ncbi:MAG: glycine--tRNA ligase beta subunit [Fimbriimonadales bacterium]|nr:MAG: glycine--tRNA ligase beta subunit [Fimbriimonadales bacterium]
MSQVVVEVGCEELPAHSVRPACEALLDLLAEAIERVGLSEGQAEGRWYGTPRRLIAVFDGILERQADREVERRGPSKAAAYDSEGNPTKALLGFCRGAGVELGAVEIRDDYVWVRKLERGRAAVEVLAEEIPAAIRKIPFDKTMRWGAGRMRFARPIRWILALVDGAVVPFQVETVPSGASSRGHRFLAPDPFEVASWEELAEGLRKRFVEPDPEERRRRIVEGARSVAGGVPVLSEELVDENVYLTEHPIAICGEFRPEFLELPRAVLVAAMAKYQRFFPVEGEDGRLANRFVSISNGGDPESVRKGNEWVLNARFNDAKFFFEEDSRRTLDEFLEQTERIVFQERLGTIRQRADRLADLAGRLAEEAELEERLVGLARKAGLYAKADLSTGLVSEIPALQGKIGGEYAKREGFEEEVCMAISEHYAPSLKDGSPGGRLATITLCADQADRIAGFVGIGELPSGSKDPYALRRAMGWLIDAQIAWPFAKKGVVDWIVEAAGLYREQGFELKDDLTLSLSAKEILEGRYELLYAQLPHDALDAAWAVAWREPSHQFDRRVRFLAEIGKDTAFVRLAKRAGNIVSAARRKGIEVPERVTADDIDSNLFENEAEVLLYEAVQRADSRMSSLPADDFEGRVEVLRGLREEIEAFFDNVMVMADDAERRDNRLALLSWVDNLARTVADFGKFVIEGE